MELGFVPAYIRNVIRSRNYLLTEGFKLFCVIQNEIVSKAITKKAGKIKIRKGVGRPKSSKREGPYLKMGKNFASLRRERLMTQEMVSEKLGIGLKYWQALEAGDKAPSFAMLCNIRKGLGCDWNGLLEGC